MNSQANSVFLKDFKNESLTLVLRLNSILSRCEGDFSKVGNLDEYAQTVDRVMGAAVTLAEMGPSIPQSVRDIGDVAGLCKVVGYKASQITDNSQFYEICVALLQDATEVLEALLNDLMERDVRLAKSYFSKTLVDRLRWISEQFSQEYRSSVGTSPNKNKKMNQAEIDTLLKKLGLD